MVIVVASPNVGPGDWKSASAWSVSQGPPPTNPQPAPLRAMNSGSAQQSVRVRILRGFLESDEFGLSGSQSLRLQQQIVHISITAAAAEQSFDVAVDGFNHTHGYLRPAVVQDALQMIQQ